MNDALKSVGADDQTTHSGLPFKVSTTVNSSVVQSDSVGADDETTHSVDPFEESETMSDNWRSARANDETTHCRLLPSGRAANRHVNGVFLTRSATLRKDSVTERLQEVLPLSVNRPPYASAVASMLRQCCARRCDVPAH